jgi:hypothetical protein
MAGPPGRGPAVMAGPPGRGPAVMAGAEELQVGKDNVQYFYCLNK